MKNKRIYSIVALSCTIMLLSSYKATPENKIEKKNRTAMYDVIIVPGIPYNIPEFEETLRERILWAKYLLEYNFTKNIIFSGAAVHTPFIEAKIMKLYADSMHLPSNHIFEETDAEHTTENVYFSLRMAKKLGFKKIALSTDEKQAKFISFFIKHKCPEVSILPVNKEKLNKMNYELPKINPNSAVVHNFVPLIKRKTKFQMMLGTTGLGLKINENKEPNQKKHRHHISESKYPELFD